MATYTASFTTNILDNGNLSSYSMYSDSIYSISNGMNNGSLFDDMNAMQAGLQSFYGGSVSYVMSGGSTWLDTTTVTWTIDNPTFEPYFINVITENYYYPMKFGTTAVTTVCNECQFIQLNQCGDENFYIDLGLTDGNYTAYYADNTSGVIWEQGTYNNTAQGGLYVYQWFATAGMFNQYSLYTMTVRDTNGDAVSWIRDGIEYNCATITFKTTVNVTD